MMITLLLCLFMIALSQFHDNMCSLFSENFAHWKYFLYLLHTHKKNNLYNHKLQHYGLGNNEKGNASILFSILFQSDTFSCIRYSIGVSEVKVCNTIHDTPILFKSDILILFSVSIDTCIGSAQLCPYHL
jgi:hypothetical protein